MTFANRAGKRMFDIIGASAALFVFALPMMVVALWIRVRLGSPVIFTQVRPGLGGRSFRMFKFRTMRDLRDASGELLPDVQRMTRVGSFLRAASLDELPEFWNVLLGEMSLVGPRPLLMEYLPLYSSEESRRHDRRPGITGWAQINGRNAQTWEDRFRLDVWYVDHQSFWLDLKILALTVIKVLQREGVSANGHVTMPKFTGVRGKRESHGSGS